MTRLRIENFGPINQGNINDEGWINFGKVTVFTGNQGSGKSTVAKLFSTISWIEKALIRGDLNVDHFNRKGSFEKHCEYQYIQEYFRPDTHIEYEGVYLQFLFSSGRVTLLTKDGTEYHLPKIMYIPSERNFISSIRNITNIKGLPGTLYTFSDEYLRAVDELKLPIELPINNVRFDYQKLNEMATITGANFKIRLMHASSGFQSFVPMYIVSKYLTESVIQQRNYFAHNPKNDQSLEEDRKLRTEIERILLNPKLNDRVKQIQIELLSSRINYSSLINVIEEPEQNLYPTSQMSVLYSLLSLNNSFEKNKLVLTTHSPYLINYLSLAVKAGMIIDKNNLDDNLKAELSEIVHPTATLRSSDLNIYELDETSGSISKLANYKGVPSDENNLNEELDEFNSAYSHLVDIQSRLK